MATRSCLSVLFESLLLTTLLLGLSFSSCNATSRNMGRTDRGLLDGAALPSGTAASTIDACAGRESCQTRSTMEQDLDTMHQSAKSTNSLSFMDSAAALAKSSDQKMANHDDNSEWVRGSELKNMNMEHSSLDPNRHREDQTSLRDSDRMRENSEWMRDAPHRHLSELEKMSDARMDRMSDSERITDSADTMSDVDKRIRNPQRLRDSQRTRQESQSRAEWSAEKMRDIDSDRSLKEADRSRGSERLSSGSQKMRDSDMSMRDSHRTIASDGMRDAQNMIDSEGMSYTHSTRDSQMIPNSDRMMDSDGLKDSQIMRTSQKMDTMDHERSSRHLEEMLNSENRRDSNQMMDQNRLGESATNLRNSESWSSAALGNAQDEQSEMMQDSYSARTSEGRRDLESTTDANSMMDSAQTHNNVDGEKGLGSETMGDAEQMNNLPRREDLERTRNSANMQGWEQTSANSHTTRNSNAARSMMGNMMERQQSSTSFCQGKDCRSSSNRRGAGHRTDSRAMEHETMPLSSRRSDAEMVMGSQSGNSEADSIDSSTATERCSGMNGADCDAAIDGELQSSQKMHISQRNHDLSLSSCRLGGADCRMAEADNNPRSMETMQSTTRGRMSSCSNGDCHTNIAQNEEPMAARQHRTRNDREIISSPKWVKMERTTSAMNEAAKKMANTEETLPMANQGMTKSIAAGAMEASRDGHFGPIDAGRRSSNMGGSTSNRLTRSTAEITGASSCTNGVDCRRTSGAMHMSRRDSEMMGRRADSEIMERRHAQEITGRSSCTNGADCRSSSDIMHLSPRDSEFMGHSDEKIIDGQSSCMNGADCHSTSGTMHMSRRDSEMMGHKDDSEMTHTGSNWSPKNGDLPMDQEMVDNSEMMHMKSDQMTAAAEINMHNSNGEAAENLPIHRGN